MENVGGKCESRRRCGGGSGAAAVSALNMTYDQYVMQHKNAITLCVFRCCSAESPLAIVPRFFPAIFPAIFPDPLHHYLCLYLPLAFTHSRLSLVQHDVWVLHVCLAISGDCHWQKKLPPPPHHTLSTRRSPPNNFSSAAHLAIFPAAIHPPECHALFALLVKFNVKSIGKRKTMAAIEPTAGKWIKDTKNNNTAF